MNDCALGSYSDMQILQNRSPPPPEQGMVAVDRIEKAFLSHLWNNSKGRSAVDDRSYGNNAASSRGRMVNSRTAKKRHAKHKHAPLPPPPPGVEEKIPSATLAPIIIHSAKGSVEQRSLERTVVHSLHNNTWHMYTYIHTYIPREQPKVGSCRPASPALSCTWQGAWCAVSRGKSRSPRSVANTQQHQRRRNNDAGKRRSRLPYCSRHVSPANTEEVTNRWR